MIKIKSISDVITNSSSETYIIKTNLDNDEIIRLLVSVFNPEVDSTSGGMGGEICSKDIIDKNDNRKIVDIDWNLHSAIKYLKDHFEILATDQSDDYPDIYKYLDLIEQEALNDIGKAKNDEEINKYYERYEQIQRKIIMELW